MTALKLLVAVMGVLIVLGLGAVAWRGYDLLSRGEAPRDFGDVRLGLPDGCRIIEARPDGGRLIVQAGEGGGCERVYILDLATGELMGTIVP